MTNPTIAEAICSADDLLELWRILLHDEWLERRTLYLAFLDADDVPQPILVPIADLPAKPAPGGLDGLGRMIAQLEADGAVSVIMALARSGDPMATLADKYWHQALRELGAQLGMRWPVVLYTPAGPRVMQVRDAA